MALHTQARQSLCMLNVCERYTAWSASRDTQPAGKGFVCRFEWLQHSSQAEVPSLQIISNVSWYA